MEIIKKVWGEEHVVYRGPYVVKTLNICPGKSLSLQYHNEKTETMIVMSGVGHLSIIAENSKFQRVEPMDYIHINPGVVHRIENIGETMLIIFEASTPEVNDTVRLKVYE